MASVEWTETASADNVAATATHSGVSGDRHYLLGLAAGYTGNTSGNVRFKDGTTVLMEFPIHNDFAIDFGEGIPVSVGADLVIEIDASGTASDVGFLNVYGRTDRQ